MSRSQPKKFGTSRSNKVNNPFRDTKGKGGMRDNATIRRLKMYNTKPTRNKDGMIIGGQYMSKIPDEPTKRIAPDRRWFGNTHIVGQKNLDDFREQMSEAVNDPFAVVMKTKNLPMALLTDTFKDAKPQLLGTESFKTTFGAKSTRKRPKNSNYNSMDSLMKHVVKSNATYKKEDDGNIEAEWSMSHFVQGDRHLKRGQSKRVWSELYKVIDASDVLVQVLDVRDPMGTRCKRIEDELKETDRRHKHMVLLLNKCDLVPTWVTAAWAKKLGQEYPTIAFHASITNSFGKGALISLLRQFACLHQDKKQISVGFVGYPNVGKSSIINTLKQKQVCVAAPVPGQTKVWQYITLFRRVFLVDCPGVVYPNNDTHEDIVLKGIIRIQNIEDPETYVPEILRRVRKEYIYNAYAIEKWDSPLHFLEQFCNKSGKLLKKGEPDIHNGAAMILNDWQRGRLPYFVAPTIGEDEKKKLCKNKDSAISVEQLFNAIPVKNKFISKDAEAPAGLSLDNSDKQNGEHTGDDVPAKTTNLNEKKITGDDVPTSTNSNKKTVNQQDTEKKGNTQEQEVKNQNQGPPKQSKKRKTKKTIPLIMKDSITPGNPWRLKKKRRKKKRTQRQREQKVLQDLQLEREREIRLEKQAWEKASKQSNNIPKNS